MSEALKKQREGYVAQLQQVEQGLAGLAQQKARYEAQREQLKGAIFALDSLSQAEVTNPKEKVEEDVVPMEEGEPTEAPAIETEESSEAAQT